MIQLYDFSNVQKHNLLNTLNKVILYSPNKVKEIFIGKNLMDMYLSILNNTNYGGVKISLKTKYNNTNQIEVVS